MLSLVRGGPRILRIEALDSEPIEEYLHRFAEMSPLNPEQAVDAAGEDATLVLLAPSTGAVGRFPWSLAFATFLPPEVLLCGLINERIADRISHVTSAPGIVLVRLMGDLEKAVDAIRTDLEGEPYSQNSFMSEGEGESTRIHFTNAPLNRPLTPAQLSPVVLAVRKPYGVVLSFLRERALDYLSLALGTHDWNDLEIRIYDTEQRYDLHYRRLTAVIEGMQLGMVLGEGWGRDQALMLMSVPIYRVRLFSPLPPQRVKEVALGLEYDRKGRRICDLDVFSGGKHLSWTAERKSDRRLSRNELGLRFRGEILSAMPPEAATALEALDPE
jgi:hypothetical protein